MDITHSYPQWPWPATYQSSTPVFFVRVNRVVDPKDNAGRSQMAAALFNKVANPTKAQALSTGTQPGDHVHPEVVTATKELGIDLGTVKPRRLTDEVARSAEWLITMGCGDACPVVPGIKREDWELSDPNGQPVDRVREIRDDIRVRVEPLVAENGWGR